MVLLHHYTNRAGKDGIYSAGRIFATDDGDGLGRVVKFTELPSGTPKADLVADIWQNSAPSNALDRTRFWFKFELQDLPSGTVKAPVLGSRTLWICPSDVPLMTSGRGPSRLSRSPSSRPPRRAPLQSGNGRTILYHYTDQKGKDAILKSGVIKAMRPHAGQGLGGSMPIAVYLTETIPTAPKVDLLFNMFGTKDAAQHPDFLEKTRFWFKFDAKDIPGVRKRQTQLGRNEWICNNHVFIKCSSLV